jgi:arabinan endo-1,5-alpha-L-arabinosidase
MRKFIVFLAVLVIAVALPAVRAGGASQPEWLKLDGDIEGVHDPVIMKEGDTYYVFCTGGGRGNEGIIPIRTSKDLQHWQMAGYVFDKLPAWATQEIPKAKGAWAPDISYYGGKYHLYYALSSFGVNESAIGLATNQTLDPKSPEYKWVDEGLVVHSVQGKDDFNAIDPNLVIEDERNVWLNWGSFWGGIKMRRIDPRTGKLSNMDTTLYSLAARPRNNPHQTPPVEGAIEAPFLVRHGDNWYLFVSFDFCCRGPKSDYKVVVGRSRKVTGPFVDKDGKPMAEGGGSLVVEAATDKWHGVGHEAVLRDGGNDYLLVHAYDASSGKPSLQISLVQWDNGWPRVAPMP